MKNKLGTILIIITTIILAGIAIFTAVRLYQLRQESISPAAPESKPAAQEANTCQLSFTLTLTTSTPTATATSTATATATATATSTSTPTATPTATATSTPVPQCNQSCTSNSGCPSNLYCYIASGSSGFCRNSSCSSETDCACATTKPTATPTAPSLPSSGTSWPTLFGAGLGILVIVGSLLLAL